MPITKTKPKQLDETKITDGVKIDTNGNLTANVGNTLEITGEMINVKKSSPLSGSFNGLELRTGGVSIDLNSSQFERIDPTFPVQIKFGTTAGVAAEGNHSHDGLKSFQSQLSNTCDAPSNPLPPTVDEDSIFVIINGIIAKGESQAGHSSITYDWVYDTNDRKIYFNTEYDGNDKYLIYFEA